MMADPPKEATGTQIQGAMRDYEKVASDYIRSGSGDPQALSPLRFLYQSLKKGEQPKDYDAVTTVVNVLSYEGAHFLKLLPANEYFRALTADKKNSTQDAILFALLLKKADQLGIHFPPNLVNELIQRDMSHSLDPRSAGLVEKELRAARSGVSFTSEKLLEAIGNEYRARAALVTIQGNTGSGGGPFAKGESATYSSGPGAVTPYEFYQFYRDRCREMNYTLFEIPTESLVSQVKDEPSAKERNQLFMKYRTEEADPVKDTPGFKESRKVKIDFVTVDAKAPRVANGVKPITAASLFLSGVAGPMSVGGNGILALAQAAQPSMAETQPLAHILNDQRAFANGRINPGEQFFFRPRDTSIYRPEPLVALLGALAGPPSPATVSAAYSLTFRSVELDHLKRITPMLLQAWAAPFNPTPANALGWPALAYSLSPKPLPDALYVTDIAARLKKDQVRNLFEKDTDEFQNKMMEAATDMFGPAPDKAKAEAAKAAANKYAKEWATARGLTMAGTKEPVSKTMILTDPALKPLVDAAAADPTKDPADTTNAVVRKFFDTFPQQDPRLPPMMQTMAFDPEFFPNSRAAGEDLDKPTLLVWLSDEATPVAYASLEAANAKTNGDMTKRVDAAWKLDKAKALAKAEADKLAEKVAAIAKTIESNKPGVDKQFKELPQKQIEITGLAK